MIPLLIRNLLYHPVNPKLRYALKKYDFWKDRVCLLSRVWALITNRAISKEILLSTLSLTSHVILKFESTSIIIILNEIKLPGFSKKQYKVEVIFQIVLYLKSHVHFPVYLRGDYS